MPTFEQLYGAFTIYNTAIWPMQVITYLLGIAALILVIKKTKYSDKIISGILAFLWLWSGIVFWIIHICPNFPIFYFFGVLFPIQSILFLIFGVIKPHLSFKFERSLYSNIGVIFVLYAMIIYPLIGYFTGHPYPDYPIFGAFPCPVCIFTFGLLLWTNKKIPRFIVIIPLIHALSGIIPVMYKLYADIGLIISGIIGTWIILRRKT